MTFDLHDPETMAFDESPDQFVVFQGEGLVFTVRGIAHLAPRFAAVGVDIASLQSAADFHDAYARWTDLEAVMLLQAIETKAHSTNVVNEHQILLAAITQGFDAAEALTAKLVHKNRASLKSVS